MTEIDERPPAVSVAVAAVFAMLATVATAATSVQGAAGVGLAVVLLAVGLVRRSPTALSWGVAVGAAGLVLAASGGGTGGDGGVLALLVAAVSLAVAWDVGDHALSLGAAVGRDARSARNQFVHAGTSLLVGTLAAGVAYGTYISATGGQPIAALVFLLFGAVVLVSAFR